MLRHLSNVWEKLWSAPRVPPTPASVHALAKRVSLIGALAGAGLWLIFRLDLGGVLLVIFMLLLALCWLVALRAATLYEPERLPPGDGPPHVRRWLWAQTTTILYRLYRLILPPLALTAVMIAAALLEVGWQAISGGLTVRWLAGLVFGALALISLWGMLPAITAAGIAFGLRRADRKRTAMLMPLLALVITACAGLACYRLGPFLLLALLLPGDGCLFLAGWLLPLIPLAVGWWSAESVAAAVEEQR